MTNTHFCKHCDVESAKPFPGLLCLDCEEEALFQSQQVSGIEWTANLLRRFISDGEGSSDFVRSGGDVRTDPSCYGMSIGECSSWPDNYSAEKHHPCLLCIQFDVNT